jgi:hypothetical protein
MLYWFDRGLSFMVYSCQPVRARKKGRYRETEKEKELVMEEVQEIGVARHITQRRM